MKKLIIVLCCISLSYGALRAQSNAHGAASISPVVTPTTTPQPPPVDPNAGKFKFAEETHDFGTVPEGPLAECDFKFKNVGKSPIVITEAHGSCYCTSPTWPHDPIMPNQEGVIHVAFASRHRWGAIKKDIIINSNAQQNPMTLHIVGNVASTPDEVVPRLIAAPAGKN